MEYTKSMAELADLSERLENKVKTTTDDPFQFEVNCRDGFKSSELKRCLKFLQTWVLNIGKEVYPYEYEKRLGYAIEFSEDILNKTKSEPVVLTEEMFLQLEKDFLNYQVTYWTKELIEREVNFNSTHKLGNLIKEWRLEGKQFLIETYKSLLHYV